MGKADALSNVETEKAEGKDLWQREFLKTRPDGWDSMKLIGETSFLALPTNCIDNNKFTSPLGIDKKRQTLVTRNFLLSKDEKKYFRLG